MPVLEAAANEARAREHGTTRFELRSQRRLLFIAGVTYLLWWFAVEAILPGSYNPLAGRLIVVAFFFLALAVSFVRGIAGRSMEGAIIAGVWLLTLHYFHLVHKNPGAMPWAVGAYIVVIAAGACLRTRRAQLAYSALCLTLGVIVSLLDPVLLHSIFLPGLATMLVLSNVTLHTRALLEQERADRLREGARREAAEMSVAAREEFIGIASHELYTPLTALQLTLDSLESRFRQHPAAIDGAHAAERLARCQRHVMRLRRLVDELLAASRVGARELTLHLEEVRLLELVDEVRASLEGTASRTKNDVTITGDPAITLRCDRMRIEQVITNLVRNALIFGASKDVRVAVERTAIGVRITVSDRGIGIAREDQARIFEKYERAVSAEHYGGLGLGLYITKQIVLAHGGTIRVESEPGAGATFVVDLPSAPIA